MYRVGSKCAVEGCENYKSNKRVSFYRFPKDKDLCMKWIILTQKPRLDELLKTRGPEYIYLRNFVCSEHFQQKDFRNKNMLSQGIWRGSVPSLLLPKPKQTGPDGAQQGKLRSILKLTNNVQNDSAANKLERGFTASQESTEQYIGENKHFLSDTREPDQVSDRITVKVEPELWHEGNSSDELKLQACDMVTVKEEPFPECEGDPSEQDRPQEPEYIAVKGEPEEEEVPAERDSPSFW